MHSRIFQISKETIDVSDYIEASDIPEGFQSGIADYVVDVEDRTAELKCADADYNDGGVHWHGGGP